MAEQTMPATRTTRPARTLLHRVFLVNSLSSAIAGIAFVVASNPIANLIGVANPLAVLVIGVGLLLFAAGVFYVVSQPTINRRAAWLIFELDVIWIVSSAIILLTDAFGLSTAGRWLVLILADMVVIFAIIEFIGLRRRP